jgi:uncharacterized LabA/DUF88 family protein
VIQVFIDGANVWRTSQGLKKNIDFKKLMEFFKKGELLRISYYTALDKDAEDTKTSKIRPMLDWLDYNGFRVVDKYAKTWINDGIMKIKGDMDLEIAVDMLRAAKHGEDLWLFSGDGDFTYLVHECQRMGSRVTVCSSIKTQPSMCADELRRVCDEFVEIDTLPIFGDRNNRWS